MMQETTSDSVLLLEEAQPSVKGRVTRRKYEEAFDKEEADCDQDEHIVPEPTVQQNIEEHSKGNNEIENRISCQVPSCTLSFSRPKDYQNHYESRHMNSCSICKTSLPSAHILELHVLEIHDTLFGLMAEKKPMYQCFLETCKEKFSNPESRKEHCINGHNFDPSFQFWDCKPPKQNKPKPKKGEKQSNKGASSSKSTIKNNSKKEDDFSEEVMIVEQEGTVNVAEVNKEKSFQKGNSKSKSVPKHIAFGHTPHRSFKNAYSSAIDSEKNKPIDSSSSIDMKDVEDALTKSQ